MTTDLSTFRTEYEILTPAQAADRLGLGIEMFDTAALVFVFDGESYVSQVKSGCYTVIIGREDSIHVNLPDAATRLYLEHYVFECVEPTEWTTSSLCVLLLDFARFNGLKFASADEMLHDIIPETPDQRTAQTAMQMDWLEWFIDLWNETELNEDAAFLASR